ncbi:MAG: aryl-sulfate sulfotransferase [Pseudomonadota bacterium]
MSSQPRAWPALVAPCACSVALLTWLAACQPQPTHGDSPPPGDDTSPPPVEMFEDIQVEVSEEIPTVATLTWKTLEPAVCEVTFGAEGGSSATTAAEGEASSEHEAVLVGVPQQQEIVFEIAASAASGEFVSEPQHYTTGTLSPDLPDLRVLVEPEEQAAGAMYLGTTFSFETDLLATDGLVGLMDAGGNVLWAVSTAFAPRARLAPDGTGVLYLSQGMDEDAVHVMVRQVSWTGEVLWEVEEATAQRDFAILDDGTVAVLVRDDGAIAGHDGEVSGDALMLLHPDGSTETTWSVFDQLGPSWCTTGAGDPTDWSHADFLEWLPEQGLLLIVLRELQAIVAIDPWTGEQAWLLAEQCGDFVNEGGEPLLVNPHSVLPTADGLLIFNQGEHAVGCSGAIELAFDPAAPTVSAIWSWEDPACLHTGFMGNAQPLPSGNRLVTMEGLVRELAPDGTVVHEIYGGIGVEFGYVEQVEGLYP